MEYNQVVLTSTAKNSQKTLQELNDLRTILATKMKQKAMLKKEIEKLQFEENGLSGELIYLLRQGHKISKGKFTAKLKVIEKLPRLAWKQIFIRFVPDGRSKAEKLLAERKPNREPYIEISVR
jgi:hypothetical protein